MSAEARTLAHLNHAATTYDAIIETYVLPRPEQTVRELQAEAHGLANLALWFIDRDEHGDMPPPFFPLHPDGDEDIYDEMVAEFGRPS